MRLVQYTVTPTENPDEFRLSVRREDEDGNIWNTVTIVGADRVMPLIDLEVASVPLVGKIS